jgi:hypothetical protein
VVTFLTRRFCSDGVLQVIVIAKKKKNASLFSSLFYIKIHLSEDNNDRFKEVSNIDPRDIAIGVLLAIVNVILLFLLWLFLTHWHP